MFFSNSLLQIRDRVEPETYHIFPHNFVKICSILKPETKNKLTN